jgi:hypothetical protein
MQYVFGGEKGKMTLPCGCRFQESLYHDPLGEHRYEIIWCEVHKHAEEMREGLKLSLDTIRKDEVSFDYVEQVENKLEELLQLTKNG